MYRTLTLLLLSAAIACAQTAGGLVAPPTVSYTDNLLENPGFETTDGNNLVAWAANGFTRVTNVSRSGNASYRIIDANTIPYAQSARQNLQLTKGTYTFSAWVKLQDVAVAVGFGVRVCVNVGDGWPYVASTCSVPLSGTDDWQQFASSTIVVPADGPGNIQLQCYGDPDGTAWFDDVELRRERNDISVFLRDPPYRGVLWNDKPQTTKWTIWTEPPDGAAYLVEYVVTDETDGDGAASGSWTAALTMEQEIDFAPFDALHSFLVEFKLVREADSVIVGTYPAYRIVRHDGANRASWTTSVDEHNRLLVRGEPTFILGVYDSGLGYASSEQRWIDMLADDRRLWELPINFYLNYWYGEAGDPSITYLLNVLNDAGILYLQTHNGFASGLPSPDFWWETASEEERDARATHDAFMGVYLADESAASSQYHLLEHSIQNRAWDPDGVNFGAMFGNADLPLWRDLLDVLYTDPYPLYGSEPAGGYDLSLVADWTRMSREATLDSRPVGTVLQFFKFTSAGRWPTRDELRNMSYMAIAEGANGLVYWSIGAGALSYVCDGSTPEKSPSGTGSWCPFRVDRFNDLKAIIIELEAIKGALAGVDANAILAANSNSEIHTRVKQAADGTTYLIASNNAGVEQTAEFTWASAPTVAVYAENREIVPSGNVFTDTFPPYGARVYQITTEAEPPPLPRTIQGHVTLGGVTITLSTGETAEIELSGDFELDLTD